MEEEPTITNVSSNMCRACLSTDGMFQSIFLRVETVDININLAEMIMEYSSVQITLGDGLPEIICLVCADKCVELFKFKRKCETTDLALRRLFSHIKVPMKVEPKEHQDNIDDLAMCQIRDQIASYNKFSQVDKVKVESGDNAADSLDLDALDNDESNDSILDALPLKLLFEKKESKKHKCDNCNMRFKKLFHLNRHVKAYSRDGLLTCRHKKKRLTPHDFNLSECDKAEITEKIKLKNKKYKHECPTCKKLFMKPSHLIRHSKVHSKAARNHICIKCKKAYATIEQLETHMKIHSGIKPHVCKVCMKEFKQICTLKDHMRTHSGEKPFLCTSCGKGFNQSSNLQQHMQRHTGLKGHLCSECGSGFASKGELTVHLRKHTGSKPYVCPTCSRGFTTSNALTMHKRTHTGERPYECDVCHMRFARSHVLGRHKLIHTGEKPHVCKFCGRAFTQSNDLKKHLKTHAGEKLEDANQQPKGSKSEVNPLFQPGLHFKFF